MELKIRIESDNRDVRNAISSIEDIIVLKIIFRIGSSQF